MAASGGCINNHVAYLHRAAINIEAAAISLGGGDICGDRDGAPDSIGRRCRQGVGRKVSGEGGVTNEEERAHGVGVAVVPLHEAVAVVGRSREGHHAAVYVCTTATDAAHSAVA